MLGEPRRDVRVLVHREAVTHHVQLHSEVGAGGLVEESEELDVRVLGEALVGDQAGRDLQGRDQGGGGVADVVIGLLLRDPGADRQDRRGPVRSKAWIWVFSSRQTTTALAGGSRQRPTTSRILASSSGSVLT